MKQDDIKGSLRFFHVNTDDIKGKSESQCKSVYMPIHETTHETGSRTAHLIRTTLSLKAAINCQHFSIFILNWRY